jgi:hypothetical protein
MTGILLCCAALVALVGALYLVLCHGPLVAVWWYRVFSSQAVYPPEAAEAPALDPWNSEYQRARPLDEVGPCVVAGSDLDRAHRPIDEVNRRFAEQVAPYLADERAYEAHIVDCYVLPESSTEVTR